MECCPVCGTAEMTDGQDGAQYCKGCGTQSQNFVEEQFDAEDGHLYSTAFVRERRVTRNEALGLPAYGSQQAPPDPLGYWPSDIKLEDAAPSTLGFVFGSASGTQHGPQIISQERLVTGYIPPEELAGCIRTSYVNGLQKMIQLQCECLVKDFGVTPLICGIVPPIWLKYVAASRVFEGVWADEVILVAEHREQTRKRKQRRHLPEGDVVAVYKLPSPNTIASVAVSAVGTGEAIAEAEAASPTKQSGGKKLRTKQSRKGKTEPRTSYGKKCRNVWLSALKDRIPLSITLAVCYLACFMAREPVLPTDMRDWATNSQLPYLSAFLDISKPAPNHIPNTVGGKPFFPMEPSRMFKPSSMVGARTIELQAGIVAERVGLQLPPVNFHSLSARFLNEMGLSTEFLDYAFRVYEWYTPAGFWLSSKPEALPTRVYVMAILVITLKIVHKLDGHSSQQKEETNTQQTENQDSKKTSMACTSGPQGGRSNLGKQLLCNANDSHLPDSDPERQVLGSTKELLKKLESFKEEKNMTDHEKLFTYLKYCQGFLFKGRSVYVDQEHICDHFWGIYSKNLKVVRDDPDNNTVNGISAKGKGIIEDTAEKSFLTIGKSRPQPGSSGREKIGASLLKDALSAAGVRGERGHMQEGGLLKQKKGKEILLDTRVLGGQEIDEESAPAPVNKLNEDLTNLTADMKQAGFSLLPAWAEQLSPHHYMRHSFKVDGLRPVHADYFYVLQACARVIDVHPRALHWCVQIVEKGLVRMENRVEKFLLGQEGDVRKLAQSINRNRLRKRDKAAEAERAKYAASFMTDFSYL